MSWDERSLINLEFPKIRQQLAAHTGFPPARELALGLMPAADFEQAQNALEVTREAMRLLDLRPGLDIGEAVDIRPIIDRAERGGVLDPAALLDVVRTLTAGRRVREELSARAAAFPRLWAIAAGIHRLEALQREIEQAVGPQAEVVDHASPLLSRLRAQRREVQDQIMRTLQAILESPPGRQVIQEPVVTVRNGRFVIPVRSDQRGAIPGLIQDVSARGATVFVEPLAVVESNNLYRELGLEEEREVQRILRRLSARVARLGAALRENVARLAELELALAKARYARTIQAAVPVLVRWEDARPQPDLPAPRPYLRLIGGRHPLLTGRVVPVDIWLGGQFIALVITGPNTGGKTVTLKTVGLLALMAQAGLAIPAQPGSCLPVFDGIYADIGDEQSIEQSLSTFSSHLTNIIGFLQRATDRSLVLLDELGAGTDPSEGAALARAILDYLVRRRVSTVVTSHSHALKVYAQATPGVENASVEFDPETLAPTYRLAIGIPGRSNAFAIAARLGLDPAVLEEARKYLSQGEVETDRLLSALQAERRRLEGLRQELEGELQRVSGQKAALEAELRALEAARTAVLNEVRRQAEAEVERLLREAARPAADPAERLRRLRELRRRVREIGRGEPAADRFRPGDAVRVPGLFEPGTIVELNDDEAVVAVGRVRVQVARSWLRPAEPAESRESPVELVMTPRTPPPAEVHLRGLTVDDALRRLEAYLDDAYLAGLTTVRVVHGRGTGTLRRVVRDFLGRHPLVAGFRPAEEFAGGEGVTVVELAQRPGIAAQR
jgi:DNA mismatch repair protein MutS2